MTPIRFEGHNATYAEDQPEYLPLPAFRSPDRQRLTFCWRLTWRERLCLLVTGRVWHQVMTFGRPLQPQLLTVGRPDMENAT